MSRNRVLVPACLVYGLLGVALGLPWLSRLLLYLKRGAESFAQLPRPVSTLWIDPLRPLTGTLDGLERPLVAATFVLLLAAFVLLARVLDPRFRLVRPAGENPGEGLGAHVDVSRLARVALAAALTLWLVGALAPIGALLAGGGRRTGPLLVLAGGLPGWTASLPGAYGPILHSILLLPLLWLLWAPGGLVSGKVRRRGGGGEGGEVVEMRNLTTPPPHHPTTPSLPWAAVAAIAATPAFLGLDRGELWLAQAAQAFSLADGAGWWSLLAMAVAVPVFCCLYLILVAYLFRTRPISPRTLNGMVAGSLVLLVGTLVAARQVRSSLRALDVQDASLARVVHSGPSPLARFAVILSPDGLARYSIIPEDSVNLQTGETLALNGISMQKTEQYLQSRRYRSGLAPSGFVHMQDCAAADWLSWYSLVYDVEMLEGSPDPRAAQLLMEKLEDCAATPENRRILDYVADTQRFRWPERLRHRWLGLVYMRFGDMARAREYLLKAGLNPLEFRQALGGISPLAKGTIRGTLLIQGLRQVNTRVGLVREDKWRLMIGQHVPFDWRHVSAFAHTDAEGRFEFKNIPEGRYVLAITGGGIGRSGRPFVSGHPGAIELDRFRPIRQLAPFDLRFERPPQVPGGRGETVV